MLKPHLSPAQNEGFNLQWILSSNIDVSASVILIIVVTTLLVLGGFLYRVTFHPLKTYPGPLFYRITGLPIFYHAWKGDLQYTLYRLHHIYGDFVRYSPNKLSIANREAFKDIYGFNKNTSKSEDFYSAFRVNKHAINTFNTTSKSGHRRKRRIMASAFVDSVLPCYENFISLVMLGWAQKVAGSGDTMHRGWEFDMAHESFSIMLDILGGLCFGEAYGFIAGKGDDVIDQIHKRALRIHMVGQEPLVKRLYLDRIFFPQLLRASNALRRYANTRTTQRIKKFEDYMSRVTKPREQDYEDILIHLLSSRDEETQTMYSYNELLGEAVLLMLAGADTGSTALNATLFYLSHNQYTLDKVKNELDRAFQSLNEISADSARGCKYLSACLDESMRLSPPIPAVIPRVVGPGGIMVVGRHIPEGAHIGVPNFTTFRDSRCFSRPHAFIPERWITNSLPEFTEESVALARKSFYPFSLGPRQCIGKRLATKEITHVLAKILYLFDVEAVGDTGKLGGSTYDRMPTIDGQAVLDQFDVFISIESGPILRFKRRKSTSLG